MIGDHTGWRSTGLATGRSHCRLNWHNRKARLMPVVGKADGGRAMRGEGVADGAPLAPQPASPLVRYAGAEAVRAGGRAGTPWTLPGRRDASVRGAGRGTGRNGRGEDWLNPHAL